MSTIQTKDGKRIVLPTDDEDTQIRAGIAADPDTGELGDGFLATAHRSCEPWDGPAIANPFGKTSADPPNRKP